MTGDDDAIVRAARARAGSPFLNTAQAAHYIGLAWRTLENMRSKGLGPRFRKHGLFAAYNAGPGRYAEHLAAGRPLPGETRDYIASLARTPATPSMPPAILSGERLFFPLGDAPKPTSPSPESTPQAPPPGTLFVPLTPPRAPEP